MVRFSILTFYPQYRDTVFGKISANHFKSPWSPQTGWFACEVRQSNHHPMLFSCRLDNSHRRSRIV